MSKTHTGALTEHDYIIPELTDSANIETAFTQFADSIREYPSSRLDTEVITGDHTAEVQTVYMYSGSSQITITLPDTGLFDGDRVVAYQLGDGEVLLNAGLQNVMGGIPSTGAKFGACSGVYVEGSGWYFLPFPL